MAVLKNFAIITGKHLCCVLFLIKLPPWRPATSLKRACNTGVFLWILQILKNSFFIKHLWWLLLYAAVMKNSCLEKRLFRTIGSLKETLKGLLWKEHVLHNKYSGTNSKNLWGMPLSSFSLEDGESRRNWSEEIYCFLLVLFSSTSL